MKRIFGLIFLCMCLSCNSGKKHPDNVSITEDLIDLNWSYAVKDLDLVEPAAQSDTTVLATDFQ